MPAWNNPNLIRLADKIRSRLFFAHVRAASASTPISESNCHPWQYMNFMWMHNGYISEFPKVRSVWKRTLLTRWERRFGGGCTSHCVTSSLT